MRKIVLLFLLFSLSGRAQTESPIEKSIKYKVAIFQNFIKMGEGGEKAFWQAKGKVTFPIVHYTSEQNLVFRDLFIRQYREVVPIYNKMIVSYDDNDTALFVKTLIRHEEEFRALLTKEQLEHYRAKLTELEQKDPKLSESYSALYFSDKLLQQYKSKI